MLTLYSTEGCHLCEDAEALLELLKQRQPQLRWSVVDIADKDELFERYGWSIPVVRDPGGRELSWPFDLQALESFSSPPVES